MALKDYAPAEETLDKDLINGVLQWVQRALGYSDSEVGNHVVYFSQGVYSGPILAEPFAIYFFSMTDLPKGLDERVEVPGGYGQTGLRLGTLSFVGFGLGSHEMLQRLSLCTHPDTVPDNMTIENLSPILDISELDDTNIEARYSKDFAITYRLTVTEPIAPAVGADLVRLNGEDIDP